MQESACHAQGAAGRLNGGFIGCVGGKCDMVVGDRQILKDLYIMLRNVDFSIMKNRHGGGF